jgi:hypothetical protein
VSRLRPGRSTPLGLCGNAAALIKAKIGKLALYVAAKTHGIAAGGTLSSITSGVSSTGSWDCGGPIRKS